MPYTDNDFTKLERFVSRFGYAIERGTSVKVDLEAQVTDIALDRLGQSWVEVLVPGAEQAVWVKTNQLRGIVRRS